MSRVDLGTWWVERFKLQMLLLGVLLMVVSAITTVREVRYALFGDVAQGKIVSVARAARSGDLRLTVQFVDGDGTERKAVVAGGAGGWTEPAIGTEIELQYQPGPDGAARVNGTSAWFMTIPFIAGSIAFIVASVQFWREYADHQRREARLRDEYS